jgi:transcriptional regulator with GAF, ATPase, and Fis domain
MELKNRNLEQIIDAIPSWVFLKNKDHRYVRVNPAYATVYGLEPSELIGKTSVDLGVDEELALGNPEKGIVGYYADDDWVLSNHQSKHIPSEPIVVNGELRYLSTVKMPVYDAVDECELVLGLAHDITHLKEIESKIATELRYNKTLYDINELFRTSGDSLSIYNKVCEVALAALKCSRVAIVVDGKSSGQCILSEKCCDESLDDPADCTSAVIEFDESVFGVLELERDAENGKFSEDDKRLGQGIANHLALAIQQHELYREIRHQARHDSLTDLPNR